VVSQNLIKALRTERGLLANQIASLDAALAALNGSGKRSNDTVPAGARRNTMSKAARLKISAAQKARWAKLRKK
jgi:hypothetical protein